jgi:hypothetical protein
VAAQVTALQNSRTKALIIPREHGAWGMLLVPLLTGALVAAPSAANAWSLTLLVLAALSLFWLRTPLEAWLGTSAMKARSAPERRLALSSALAISTLAAVAIASLLWNGRNRGLLLIGAIAAIAFAVQAWVKRWGRKGRMPAQIIGAAGLTSTAAGAYYVTTGKLDHTLLALWLANCLFAADQVHFVQLRIHAARASGVADRMRLGRTFLWGQAGLIGIILVLCRSGFLPMAAALAFVPILLRGSLWFTFGKGPLDVHKLGFAELAQGLLFAGLLCAAFAV